MDTTAMRSGTNAMNRGLRCGERGNGGNEGCGMMAELLHAVLLVLCPLPLGFPGIRQTVSFGATRLGVRLDDWGVRRMLAAFSFLVRTSC